MSYTYDITTNVGKVRLLTGDKILTDPVFTDEEIEIFLSRQSNSINLAAAEALEAWAASYSANANSEEVGDYAYTQKIIDNMLKLAKQLRANEAKIKADEATEPVVDWSSFNVTDEEE